MIVKEPFISPADPSPATARATINIFEEVARPQRSEPSSKTKKKDMNAHCILIRIDC
jgi:hypothetical protein